MYARPELVDTHNRFWALIRHQLDARGVPSPAQLSQEADVQSVWNHPELVLSQTCGMPYRTWLHGNVKLVGTPDYGLDDCQPGYYRSPLVVRSNDTRNSLAEFADSVLAYNQTFSQSGYAAPYWHTKPHHMWFARKHVSGGHLKSALAVAEGDADIAALDAVTWRLIQQYENFSEQLRVLEWTAPTPGLPLITSLENDSDAIFDAVKAAINDLSATDQILLGIEGLVKISAEDYLAVMNPDLDECKA